MRIRDREFRVVWVKRKIDGETQLARYNYGGLTNDSAVNQETCDCDAYGNTTAYNADGVDNTWFTDDDVVTNNPTCQFIFTGRRFDPETSNATTQMYFYRARYYSPVLGRFISRDPIDYAGGMNLYEYVGGMAVGAVDPTGQWEVGVGFWGTPIHETFSRMAASAAGLAGEENLGFLSGMEEGVVWPDLPDGIWASLMYLWDVERGAGVYSAAKRRLAERTRRSHYGDWVYIHGMGAPGACCKDLAKAMEDWIVGCYMRAQQAKSDWRKGWEIGRALHTIQDSYCRSHTGRQLQVVGGRWKFGPITRFQYYNTQDHDWHKKLDVVEFPLNLVENAGDYGNVLQNAAAEMAVQRSTELLNMLRAGAPTHLVRRWLRKGPLKLSKYCCNDAAAEKNPVRKFDWNQPVMPRINWLHPEQSTMFR